MATHHLIVSLQSESEAEFKKKFLGAPPKDRYEAYFQSVFLNQDLFERLLKNMGKRMNLVELFIIHCAECKDEDKFLSVLKYQKTPITKKDWELAFAKFGTFPYLTKVLILNSPNYEEIIKAAAKIPHIYAVIKSDSSYINDQTKAVLDKLDVFGEPIPVAPEQTPTSVSTATTSYSSWCLVM